MKFSTKATYGLRAIVNLASSTKKVKTLKEISLQENISQKYLEKIFSLLRKNNLIVGNKGLKGGYRLTRNSEDISVKEIVEALDGPMVIAHCTSKNCLNAKYCTSNHVWTTLEKAVSKTLEEINLSNLIQKL